MKTNRNREQIRQYNDLIRQACKADIQTLKELALEEITCRIIISALADKKTGKAIGLLRSAPDNTVLQQEAFCTAAGFNNLRIMADILERSPQAIGAQQIHTAFFNAIYAMDNDAGGQFVAFLRNHSKTSEMAQRLVATGTTPYQLLASQAHGRKSVIAQDFAGLATDWKERQTAPKPASMIQPAKLTA